MLRCCGAVASPDTSRASAPANYAPVTSAYPRAVYILKKGMGQNL